MTGPFFQRTENGASPISNSTRLGICGIAPLLPHLEQRTFRPVGGITAAVSKRALQAGQIMTVIV